MKVRLSLQPLPPTPSLKVVLPLMFTLILVALTPLPLLYLAEFISKAKKKIIDTITLKDS